MSGESAAIPEWLAATGIDLSQVQRLDAALVTKLFDGSLDGVPRLFLDGAEILAKEDPKDPWKVQLDLSATPRARTVYSDRTIFLTIETLGDPEAALFTFAHEIGHALRRQKLPTYAEFGDEAEFKTAYIDALFEGEANATFFELQVREEYKSLFNAANPGGGTVQSGDRWQ